VELVEYTDEDLALSVALETDPRVMAELGGPRPMESIERAHQSRIAGALADGGLWLKIVPERSADAVGALGVWRSDWRDEKIWEVGWMLLADFHGRGLGSEALGLLIERMRSEPQFDTVHAFPGSTNAASNSLCRRFGFTFVEQADIEFAGRPLQCNHWQLPLR
jgi:RimJ/RimL family protein N-acetyltransferase